MDPLTGGTVGAQDPQKTKLDEEKKTPVTETQDESVVEDAAQVDKVDESAKALGTSRPSVGSDQNQNTEIPKGKPVNTGSNFFSLDAWSSVISDAAKSETVRGFAKEVFGEGLLKDTLAIKDEALAQDEQKEKISEKLSNILNNDPNLSEEKKEQSLSVLPDLLSSLPAETKEDKAILEKTISDIFNLESVPKDEISGKFLSIARSAIDSGSLNAEQKKEALGSLLKSALPDINEVDLKVSVEAIGALPNETTKEKQIFSDAINELNGINENKDLSNLERTTKLAGGLLDSFSSYRENAVNDDAKKEIQAQQKQTLEKLVGHSIDSLEIAQKDKDLISRISSDLIINLDDNPETRGNEIKQLLDFTNKSVDLNLNSMQEIQDYTLGLGEKIVNGYDHLSSDEQVDLASRVANDVFQTLDISKEYGLDKLSPEVVKDSMQQFLSALEPNANLLQNPQAQADALKGVSHLISSLEPGDKSKLFTDLTKMSFSTDNHLSSTESNLVGVISNSLSSLSENQMNQLIDIGSAYVNSDQNIKAEELFGNENMLAAKLNMDPGKVADAQRIIADIGVGAFQDLASRSGTPVNIASLKAMLSPGPNGIVGNDGVLDNRDISRIAHQVADNIIRNPISPEERSANHRANSQREAQHQAEVRRQAHGQIRQTANQKEAQARGKLPFGGFFLNGVINRKRARQEGAAHGQAQNWYPGRPGGDQVTRGMNQGYFSSQGQAQAQMRQGVVNEAYGQISQSLNNPNSQKSINMLSQLLNKSSTPNYTKGTMRIDDLRSLESLQKLSGFIDANSISLPGSKDSPSLVDNLDINKELGIKPDLEIKEKNQTNEHGTFSVFKDKNTNEEFYRLIDKNNETKYAIKKDDGAYAYLEKDSMSYNGKSYQSVIEDFEAKKPFEIELGSKGLAGSKNDSFDMFSDKSTGQDFYRRIDEKGDALFAVKSQDSKTGWKKLPSDLSLKGRDYSGLIKEFESKNPGSQIAKSVEERKTQEVKSQASQRQTWASRTELLNVRKTANGSNGSKFIYFNDSKGKSFYAIKDRDGIMKLRIGDESSGIPMSSDYKHNGVDYSWMLDQL